MGYAHIERATLPGFNFGNYFIDEIGNDRRRYVDAIKIFELILGITRGHSSTIKTDCFIIKSVKSSLALRHNLWREIAISVSWHLNVDFTAFAL